MSDDPSERSAGPSNSEAGDQPVGDGSGDQPAEDRAGNRPTQEESADQAAEEGSADEVAEEESSDEETGDGESGDAGAEAGAEAAERNESEDLEALRRRVDEEYDFDDFGPADMAAMSAAEWEAAFDDASWVTGEELLDRVETDLRSRVADRDVFAVVERIHGEEPRVVAYSDEGYAIVHADGSVRGRGTVLRDVKPSVALASMPDYDPPEPPTDAGLPAPEDVSEVAGGLGNLVLQLVAAVLLLAGLVLLGAAVFADLAGGAIVAVVVGLGFVLAAAFLGLVVANARLSARYRAREYRDRLRAAGVDADERPAFLPIDDREFED